MKIYLITTPRTYSVCITRILEQTQLFEIFHEPYVAVYDKVHYPDLTKDWFQSTAFVESKDVVNSIHKCNSNVLVKDMAFAITDYIEDLVDENSYFILLYRSPKDVFLSLYRKYQQLNLPPDPTTWKNVSGYVQLQQLHKILTEKKCKFMLFNTDDLILCVQKIFQFLSIDFKESYLKWEKCESQEQINNKSCNWKENKKSNLFLTWHEEALQSDGYQIQKKDPNIENKEHEQILNDLSKEFDPIYFELLNLNNGFFILLFLI